MVQTIPAREIDLAQLAETFGLERTDEPDFFREWQDELPKLSEAAAAIFLWEGYANAQIKANCFHLSRHDLQKSVTKLVVLAPILKLVGLYKPLFRFVVDEKIELDAADDGMSVTGLINVLAVHPRLWLTTIEAKHMRYSLAIGIPQTLFSMMEMAQVGEVLFGLISNGQEFQFLKVLKTDPPTCALSYALCLNREDDLQRVVQILRTLSQIATREI